MQKRRWTFVVLAGACIAIVFFVWQFNGESKPVQAGDQFLDIELDVYKGSSASFSDYQDDVLVLNVWASWCEPCIREMPALMELEEDYRNKGVSVITVNSQSKELRPEDAIEFIEEQDLTLPVFFDSEGVFMQAFKPSSLPTTYIIDQNNVVTDVLVGEVTKEMLANKLQELL